MKFPIFIDLKFAIFLLFTIAFFSSLGSFIPQDETPEFYALNYNNSRPVFGFLTANLIFLFGLDHVYRTWWFFLLLFLLSFSLIACTFIRQFPLVKTSKDYFFKKNYSSYEKLPFFIVFQNSYFFKENFLKKLQNFSFSFYQTKNFLYAYKGLIG
jgi:cytochrome c biogenesis protein